MSDEYIVWGINELPEEFKDLPKCLPELEMECFDEGWNRNYQGTSNDVRRYRMLKKDYERLRKNNYGLTLSEAMVALGNGETLICDDARTELIIHENRLKRSDGVVTQITDLNNWDLSKFQIKPPEPMNILKAIQLVERGKRIKCLATGRIMTKESFNYQTLTYKEITAEWIEA